MQEDGEDGTEPEPDGTVPEPDGEDMVPDGTVLDGTVPEPDGEDYQLLHQFYQPLLLHKLMLPLELQELDGLDTVQETGDNMVQETGEEEWEHGEPETGEEEWADGEDTEWEDMVDTDGQEDKLLKQNK